MATLEQVEKLKQRANVTYDEAKEALNACGDDLLDALIYLEKQGKVSPPQNGGFYSSRHTGQASQPPGAGAAPAAQPKGESLGDMLGRLWKWTCKMLRLGNSNMFEVSRHGELVMTFPVTVLVVLLIFGFWIVLPLMIAGLFVGFRYRFRGDELDKTRVNSVMDSAAKAADSIKSEIVKPGENSDETL